MTASGTTSVDVVRAAGGVIWRLAPDGGRRARKERRRAGGADRLEVLLVHRPRYDDWSLPKGKADDGEGWKACARREVQEETGLRCTLGPLLRKVRYRDRRGRPKEVRYYEMSEPSGSFEPNDEVDEVRWLPPAEAVDLASRRSDGAVIEDLLAHLGDR